MPWTLCTKDDIMAFHPIPVAEIRDEWSDMVEGLIREHLGQEYLGLNQVITDEWHSGDGTNILKVRHSPIVSVESVSVNDAVLTASDYVVFTGFIQLKAQTFPVGTLNVKVSYTSGSSDMDPIVRLAATTMVIAIINYRKRAGADSSLRWSSTDQKTGEESPNSTLGLVGHLKSIMKGVLKRPGLKVR